MANKMIKCKTCNADIASSAKVCPSCGAKNKKPFYTKWFLWVIVLIVMAGAITSGINGNTNSTNKAGAGTDTNQAGKNTDTKAPVADKKEDFEIVGELETERDAIGTIYISGIIKNNKNRDCSYVQVTFNLFDNDGNLVGTAIANVNNLASGGTWKFKAIGLVSGKDVTKYQLAEITGF